MDAPDHVRAVLGRLKGVRPSGSGWEALCPAHEDRSPSLSIGIGEDGRALVYCHKGCTTLEICRSIGIEQSALFPPQTGNGETARKIEAVYRYDDVDGNSSFEVVRYRPKDFRVRRPDGSWGMGDTQRVLYRLPELMAADPAEWTLLPEGEKDADMLAQLGFVSTATVGGAAAWRKTDLSPLHGRKVVLLADNDQPGRQRVQDMAAALHGKAVEVRIVEFSDLPPGGDVSDWIATFVNEETDVADLLDEKIEKARPYEPEIESPSDPITVGETNASEANSRLAEKSEALEPVPVFDLKLLPDSLQPWIIDIAERMQCPPDYPAVAATVVLASAIGRQVCIRPKQKDDWAVTPNLWGLVVGPPGVMKSPAISASLKPLKCLEATAKEVFDVEMAEWSAHEMIRKANKKAFDRKLAKMAESDLDAAMTVARTGLEETEKPIRRRYLIGDSTAEKLAVLSAENPNGLCVHRDEIVGLLQIFDKPGREGDRQFYLEAWEGNQQYVSDRIGRGTTDVKSLTLSLVGGATPGRMRSYVRDAMGGGQNADGLLQRFQLLVWPEVPNEWRNVDRWPDHEASRKVTAVFQRLAELNTAEIGAEVPRFGNGRPFLRFDDRAQGRLDEWRGKLELQLRSGEDSEAFRSVLAKYRSLVPSLAIIDHLADDRRGPVGLGSLTRAIGWATYLEGHARRLYTAQAGTEGGRVLAWITERGGSTTARDLSRGPRAYRRNPERASAILERLVETGKLRRVDVPPTNQGGKPTVKYETCAPGDGDNTPVALSKMRVMSPAPSQNVGETEFLADDGPQTDESAGGDITPTEWGKNEVMSPSPPPRPANTPEPASELPGCLDGEEPPDRLKEECEEATLEEAIF